MDKWQDDPGYAALMLRRLVFGVAPDYYEGTVGQAYKVMRETWRKWQFPEKALVTHVQLRYNPALPPLFFLFLWWSPHAMLLDTHI